MAGIYIHIPFCRRACHYCDFHFTTNLKRSAELVDTIVSEIALRANYLNRESVKTIYFGGGTPSLLPTTDIARILEAIHKAQSVEAEIELTLEANPEDLSAEKLLELRSIGVNRLSLGTQSFIDSELQWMNRMHSADQAQSCIQDAQGIGFNNISIDLIFGLP
ncbi:MAG: radical SAM protein, partial [Flavobacteriales bacterium]|nr:radical SAM protein [Flavobacteriales bacterium]